MRAVIVPEGMNNLPVAIPVGSQTLHAVGLAYAIKYRKQRQIAMTFFGDGRLPKETSTKR